MKTFFLLIAAAGAAFAQTKAPSLPPPHQRPAATVPQAANRVSDAQIEAAIRLKLAKSKIAVDKFKFHAQGGVVTIEGKTDVIQHKGSATRMARTAGAVAVVNHIEISEAAKEKAAKNLEAGRRRAQVKRGDARNETGSGPASGAPARSLRKTGSGSGQNP